MVKWADREFVAADQCHEVIGTRSLCVCSSISGKAIVRVFFPAVVIVESLVRCVCVADVNGVDQSGLICDSLLVAVVNNHVSDISGTSGCVGEGVWLKG